MLLLQWFPVIMSQPHQISQSPIYFKYHHDNDELLDDLPSNFDLALNGGMDRYLSKSPNPDLLDPETFRRISISSVSSRGLSPNPTPHRVESRTWRLTLQRFWHRNQGLILVVISQAFGALMNVTTRLLELEGDGMRPFQVLFARMSLTTIFCCIWMWWKKVPDFPFGAKEVRWLLVARGLSGFFGIYGMYCKYSLALNERTERLII